MHPQLPLSLGLKDSAVFANFVAGANAEAVAYLQQLADHSETPCVYLWGGVGTGKSHLLQAICHAAGEHGLAAVYLPMRSADEFPYEALTGLESVDFVCIDDIDAVAGDYDWERALMRLFERIQQAHSGLVVTGASIPSELGLSLAPLASRLAWGLLFQLKESDAGLKQEALILRADRRGISLPKEAARYLVRHHGQNMSALFDAFERVDKASLAAKRKLTVPFIRAILPGSG